ncbi:SoxR reducing system RseC family protein [Salinibius halmophilus]|uniref:SoxR reducing system RseC family protein n=1 Tax=Salinibius halmophilus TaxID=1853216 RepID=UPI001314E19E|nr:SoxR reducing system RseC family protein [Salinibius halmophilus]
MLTESAQVVAHEGDGVWLKTLRTSACESCKAKSGCGQHAMAKLTDGERQERATQIFVQAEPKPNIGDFVTVAIPESAMLRSAWTMYGIPMLLLLVVVGGLNMLGASELVQMLAAIVSLTAGLTIVRQLGQRWLSQSDMHPRIIE